MGVEIIMIKKNIKKLFKISILTYCTMMLMGVSSIQAKTNPSIEAIAKVYGDGEHISTIILNYEKPVLAESVTIDDFNVPGRTIIKSYVSNNPEDNGKEEKEGKYVILELKELPMSDESIVPHVHSDEDIEQHKAIGKNGPELGSHGNPQPIPKCEVQIEQVGLIKATDGSIYGAFPVITSENVRELVVDDFKQDVFIDEQQNNAELKYNIYIPKNYDPAKKYPLVVFMHDAGTVSPEVKATLAQGRGAIAWAEPSWQEEHPCFVLAPQYDTIIVDDNYDYGPELDRTIHLIDKLKKEYSIDPDRIYNTGQSMGGMTTIAMDVKYSDYFAASYPVACKWDSSVTAPLGKQNIWAVFSEGDSGAQASLKEIFSNFEKAGEKVNYLTVDMSLPVEEINQKVEAIIDKDTHLYCVTYIGGSHRSTWQHAYDMLPAMEWIFAQKKS